MSRLLPCCLALGGLLGLTAVVLAADLPEVGKPAPAIDLPASNIGTVLPDKKSADKLRLEDLRGKNVVLFFYPKALTKGCTIESCGFRDKVKQFAALDTVIVGISTDPLSLQEKFTEKENLNFPLFADADKSVTKAYGALNERGVANRYTYIIDKKGVLRKIYTKVNPAKHPQEVYDFIKENLK